MSVDTTIRVTSEVDWQMFFLRTRQAVGIPDEWPFADEYDGVAHVCRSELGGGGASVTVYSHEFETIPWDDEDEGPRPVYADAFLCSSRDREGTSEALHDRVIAQVTAWLDELGATYAVCREGGWQGVLR